MIWSNRAMVKQACPVHKRMVDPGSACWFCVHAPEPERTTILARKKTIRVHVKQDWSGDADLQVRQNWQAWEKSCPRVFFPAKKLRSLAFAIVRSEVARLASFFTDRTAADFLRMLDALEKGEEKK